MTSTPAPVPGNPSPAIGIPPVLVQLSDEQVRVLLARLTEVLSAGGSYSAASPLDRAIEQAASGVIHGLVRQHLSSDARFQETVQLLIARAAQRILTEKVVEEVVAKATGRVVAEMARARDVGED